MIDEKSMLNCVKCNAKATRSYYFKKSESFLRGWGKSLRVESRDIGTNIPVCPKCRRDFKIGRLIKILVGLSMLITFFAKALITFFTNVVTFLLEAWITFFSNAGVIINSEIFRWLGILVTDIIVLLSIWFILKIILTMLRFDPRRFAKLTGNQLYRAVDRMWMVKPSDIGKWVPLDAWTRATIREKNYSKRVQKI